MTDRLFFDTNIIVYLFDTTNKKKHTVSQKLLSDRKDASYLHISSQVINEFVNVTTKKIKNPVSFEKQRDILNFLQTLFIVNPLTIHTSLTAVDLKLKYIFSYWDALILASALESDCSIIYSEDMQHNQIIENHLKIINPFIK